LGEGRGARADDVDEGEIGGEGDADQQGVLGKGEEGERSREGL
jgi:hypothetical protein